MLCRLGALPQEGQGKGRWAEQQQGGQELHTHTITKSTHLYSHEGVTAANRTTGKHWLSHVAPAMKKED